MQLQVAKALDKCVTSYAGRDTTPDAQKEVEITKENKLYEVPTSCDSQKRGMNIETKENHLYKAPTPVIKIAERDTQKKKVNIEMKEDVSYEAPTPVNMTECQMVLSLTSHSHQLLLTFEHFVVLVF